MATQPRIGRTLGAGDHVPTPTGMAIGTPRAEIVVPIDGKPRFRELSIVSCSLTFFYANGRWECQFAAVTGYDGYKGPNHYELSLNGSASYGSQSRGAAVSCGWMKLLGFRRGRGERFLERAFAAGFAGDGQFRGPGGDAAGERCGALAARDLDWCTLAELGEQPGAVLLR